MAAIPSLRMAVLRPSGCASHSLLLRRSVSLFSGGSKSSSGVKLDPTQLKLPNGRWPQEDKEILRKYVKTQKTFADLQAALPHRPAAQIFSMLRSDDSKPDNFASRVVFESKEPLSDGEKEVIKRFVRQGRSPYSMSCRLRRNNPFIQSVLAEMKRDANLAPVFSGYRNYLTWEDRQKILSLGKQGKDAEEIRAAVLPHVDVKTIGLFLVSSGVKDIPVDEPITSWATRYLGHERAQSASA